MVSPALGGLRYSASAGMSRRYVLLALSAYTLTVVIPSGVVCRFARSVRWRTRAWAQMACETSDLSP